MQHNPSHRSQASGRIDAISSDDGEALQ